jgi:hypothetical protein
MQICCESFTEDSPVTLHVLLLSGDGNDFVWVTDRIAGTGIGYATVEKVLYLAEQKIACSLWGDQVGMYVRDEFVSRIRAAGAPLSDRSQMKVFLTDLATEVLKKHIAESQNRIPRGFVLAVLGEQPHIYSVHLQFPPIVLPVVDQIMVGDENAALFFCQRYYERSSKSLPELVAIGVHTVAMAAAMNTKGIRGVDTWVYQHKKFRQFGIAEIEPYLEMSRNLDASILDRFRNIR